MFFLINMTNCEVCGKAIISWKAANDWNKRKMHRICWFKRRNDIAHEILLEDLFSAKVNDGKPGSKDV